MSIRERLFALQDEGYRDFQSRLVPNIAIETMIGVRTPELKKLARELKGSEEAARFLSELPHKYYEENNLHGYLLELISDYDELICALDAFLPYVDNWATCDTVSPKIFKKHLDELYSQIKLWLESESVYTVRFAVGMLMALFLDEGFTKEAPELVCALRSEEYYINMMRAWYFATALAKQYEAVLPYFEEHRMDVWTHNKAIQKAVESRRITPPQKEYLKTLKVKS